MGLYTACSHGPVHWLWPWACTPLLAMGLYTSCGHGPVHLWLHAAFWLWTCTLLVATDLYTACGCMEFCVHGPVHGLWPGTCTLLVAACSLVATDPYTACGHGPVHCLWPWTCTLLVAACSLVVTDPYTACVHGPVHCLCPRTCTLLVAACSLVSTDPYTACGCMHPCVHGPVHCLWLHAANLSWTWPCGYIYGPIHCLQPQPVPLHTSFVPRSPSAFLSLQLHSWKCAWHQLVNAISLNLNRVRTALQSPQYRQAPCSGLANPYKKYRQFLKAFENIVEDTGVSRHVLSPRLQDVSDFMHRLHVLLPWHLLSQ